MTSPALAPLQRIRFETVPSAVDEVLPRMDIAAFVGFASAGPLHLPVAIGDVKQYAQLFGDDPLLAWDAEAGEPVRGRLGTAVATFFANGGQRCWVVRVAGPGAVHNYFPLPGVRCAQGDGQAAPAFARARSPGSWSDALIVRPTLRTRALPVANYDRGRSHISLTGASATLHPGDLVRVQFGDGGIPRFWLHAGVLAQLPAATAGQRDYQLAMPLWFADAAQSASAAWTDGVDVRAYGAHDDPLHAGTQDVYAEMPAELDQAACGGRMRLLEDGRVELSIVADQSFANLIQPGAVLRVDVAGRSGWLVVQQRVAGETSVSGSPTASAIALGVTGVAYWEVDSNAGGFDPGKLLAAETLTIDLAVRDAQERDFKLLDVGLTNLHPRAWSGLHGDLLRYRPAPHATPGVLDDEAGAAAFPLAAAMAKSTFDVGTDAITEIYVPLGLGTAVGASAIAIPCSGDALQRDGLDHFDASLFLDDALANVGSADLMVEADYLRYGGPRPRPLRGIHAVLGFGDAHVGDEATLVAVPDAMHRSWTRAADDPGGVSAVTGLAANASDGGVFRACTLADPPAPAFLSPASGEVADSSLRIAWTEVPRAIYILEESTAPDFAAVTTLYEGAGRAVDIHRPSGGGYAFRVRAVVVGKASAWSDALTVVIARQSNYVATAAKDYDATVLHDVQTALLRMCAAQGELFAVLGLPRHFRELETRRHLATLTAELGTAGGPSPLSFGAVYHPWLRWSSASGTVETMPPDGAAMGVLAQRAALRGAWVAPCNQPLAGVVAVTQPLVIDDDVAVNIVRAEPRGFLTARADTLDTDVSLINVRRLLILLRRLALRHGATYAFEPNGSALRRLVQTRFDALMRTLYDRGAFGGQKPTDAYRVDTGNDVNSAASMDQGRFIVALMVRPSRPMEFITVRLVQHGDQLNVSEAS